MREWILRLSLLTVAAGTGYLLGSLVGPRVAWYEPGHPLYKGPGIGYAGALAFSALGVALLFAADASEGSLLFDVLRPSRGVRELLPYLGCLFRLVGFAALSFAGLLYGLASHVPE